MVEALIQRVEGIKQTIKVLTTGVVEIVPVCAASDRDSSVKLPAYPFVGNLYNPGVIMQGLLENDLELREAHLSQLMFPG